ncbi:hypothetical protein [Nonomuraea sp. SBT364]|uniref:hypothetical protein n=1 Tax=Nonomuraea sp. SBT364 TaxID=1580530 RepID=UPI0007C82315|nr:hypothetical protein [Nonomuraea sp. SBT364]
MRILGVTAVLVLSLAACGAGAETGTGVASVTGGQSASSAQPSLDPQAQGVKWAQCMRENGVDIEDPKPGQGVKMTMGPGNKDAMDKAQKACDALRPKGGMGGPGNPQNGEKLRKLAQCMRENGVEQFPDPDGGMLRMTKEVGDDPDFAAAQKTCQMDSTMGGS